MIDCLFIGYNDMPFAIVEKTMRAKGKDSIDYKNLNINFINYKGLPLTASEVFNTFYYENRDINDEIGPMNFGNIFSPAIAYLGTYLDRRKLSFEYINFFQDEKERLISLLEENKIATIGIITTFYVSAFPIIDIIGFIRRHNTDAKIVVGGPYVASQFRSLDEESQQKLFKTIGADFYVNSAQGEAALVRIIDSIKNNLPVSDINNIAYRIGDIYVKTPVLEEDNKLEENTVNWKLFKDSLGSFTAARTAISCPFSCMFCGLPKQAGKYQTISVEAIEREFNTIEETGKIKYINIVDDTFNIPLDRFKDILRMMIRNKYSFKWTSNLRCQFVDEETIQLMKEAGCEGVFLGIESGNQQILQNMSKFASIDKYRTGLSLLNKYGIISFASIIVGFPGETYDTFMDTVNFIEECQPTFYNAKIWYYDINTPITGQKEKYEIKGSGLQWSHSTMDSETAINLVQEMLFKIQNSIFGPQYNFEFVAIFNLLHRGIALNNIKKFIMSFNQGVKQKLINPDKPEISSEIVESMRKALA